MNAFVDQIVEQHNAPRAPFEVERIAVIETVNLFPFGGIHCWLNLNGATAMYIADSHAEADTIVDTALWCGSPFVTVEYCGAGKVYTETWATVS